MVGRGVVRALAALGVVACLVGWPGIGQASPSLLQIRSVQIASITDTGFIVSWTTDQPAQNSGQITYGTAPSTVFTVVSDDAEPSGAKGDIHWHRFNGLTPGQTYYFKVTTAGVTDDNNGQYYSAKLAPSLVNPPPTRTVSGIVLQPDGRTPAAGAVVTVWVLDNANLNGATGATTSQQMSVVTNQGGAWSASLDVRTQNLAAWFNYTTSGTSDFVQYSVDGASLGAASLQTIPLSLNQNNNTAMSVPTVSLFVNTTSVTPTLSPTQSSTTTSTPTVTSTPVTTTTVATSPTAELSPTPPPTLVVQPTSLPVVAALPPTEAAQPAEPVSPDNQIPPTSVPIAPPIPSSPLLPVPPLAPTPFPPAPSQSLPAPTATPDAPATPNQGRPIASGPTIPASTPVALLYPFTVPTSAAQPLPAIGPRAPAAGSLTPGPFPNVAAPTPNATAIAEVEAKGGGLPAQGIGLLASGAGLLGLGIVLVMFGLVSQTRRGA